ncbi:hypothetical protein KS4_24370 [Poriferisphaera corsica]|uniref:Uncharacterized protein n=1 Tax=Poriferisphaera corsica TaxID=2528020 RepID=A0A517YVX1_9BACT|nr:hypothetical protein [Poriferisphaera corsica]QDU34369.1 hypothetical protein KS4_24370 [Poriferisphaera corsica]
MGLRIRVLGIVANAYFVYGFPDYFVIGRDGDLFAADVKNGKIEEIVERMLRAECGER